MTEPTATPVVAQETFVEGVGFQPASNDGRVVITDGRAARVFPPEILAKIEGKSIESAKTEETPAADAAPAPVAAEPDKPADPAKAADPAKPEETAPVDDIKALFGDRKPADIKADLERFEAANRALLAEVETARKPSDAARSKLDEMADNYIDDPLAFLRAGIARGLGIDDPAHDDVTAELRALTNDLTANQFSVSLDPTQQASRDAAKARQALARDKRSRKAESDAAAKAEQAKAETSKASEAATFIGNRLAQPHTDGKPFKEQFPFAAAGAEHVAGKSFEALIFETFPALLKSGHLDPAKANDDEYLITETAKHLNQRFQVLADVLGKARPQPSTATPSPAPAPDATKSASQGPSQGHGGRSLTTANASAAPASLPSTTQPQAKAKPKTRAEFLAQRFPDD